MEDIWRKNKPDRNVVSFKRKCFPTNNRWCDVFLFLFNWKCCYDFETIINPFIWTSISWVAYRQKIFSRFLLLLLLLNNETVALAEQVANVVVSFVMKKKIRWSYSKSASWLKSKHTGTQSYSVSAYVHYSNVAKCVSWRIISKIHGVNTHPTNKDTLFEVGKIWLQLSFSIWFSFACRVIKYSANNTYRWIQGFSFFSFLHFFFSYPHI